MLIEPPTIKDTRNCCSGACEDKALEDAGALRMAEAQEELDQELAIDSKAELRLPRIQKKIGEIATKHNLPKCIEVHWHDNKAEFCETNYSDRCNESKVEKPDQFSLHAPVVTTNKEQKKTSGIKDFFKRFFSTSLSTTAA